MSIFKGKLEALGVLGGGGLGAVVVNEAMSNLFKQCANPKLKAAGKSTVAMGPLGPATCAAAFDAVTSGCVHRTAIRAECSRTGKAPEQPTPAQQAFLEYGLFTSAQAKKQLEQKRMDAAAGEYPWNVFSAKTEELQRRINAEGEKVGRASGKPAYCQIDVDGKLGPGTCGAARNLRLPTPPTCQSFATECRGTLIDIATKEDFAYQPAKPQVSAPKPVVPVEPMPEDVDAYYASQFPWATVIIGTSVAAALGVVGLAVAKKKGWIKGKRPRSS